MWTRRVCASQAVIGRVDQLSVSALQKCDFSLHRVAMKREEDGFACLPLPYFDRSRVFTLDWVIQMKDCTGILAFLFFYRQLFVTCSRSRPASISAMLFLHVFSHCIHPIVGI